METKLNELFWNANIDEIKKGYVEYEDRFKCIVCGEEYIKGRIYTVDSQLYDSKKTVELHVEEKHESMIGYLLNMNTSFTGITEAQKQLLTLISQGFSDKEIANKLGIATSTIRNHRFKLREKEKQAKMFLAIMELLAKDTNNKLNNTNKGIICDAHKTATALDDRFNITDKEKETVIKNYMDENGALKTYPSKEKKKIIVLEEIMKNFSRGKIYSEKEINRILKRIYDDNATIRRGLIEYGFIERTKDCSSYWVKE